MADDFTITMSVDDRDAVNAFLRQADKIAKLQEQLKKWQKQALEAGQAQKKAAEDGAAGADRLVGKLTAVAGGWISATSAVSAYMAANKQAIADSEKQAGILEDISKKYAVIAGIRGMESEGAQKAIMSAAMKTATSKEAAGAAAIQLVSSGMDPTEVQNGGLQAFLETLNASNLNPKTAVDSETLARSMSAYLESQGIAKTAANFRQYGAQIQQLAGPTNLGFGGMVSLAAEGAALSQLTKPNEQLAAYAKLVGSMKEPEAAVGLRNFVSRLGTAGNEKAKVGALKSMGLKPEDVDFTGEDFGTVLDRLAGGLENVPEKKRDDVFDTIFGEQAKSAAFTLVSGRDQYRANLETQKDTSRFDKDVAFAQSGRNAADRRLQLQAELASAEEAGNYGLVSKSYQNALREAGFSNFQRAAAGGIFDLASGLGASPEGAQSAAQTLFGGRYNPVANLLNGDAVDFVNRRTREAVDKSTDPEGFLARQQAELTQALKENTAATKANTPAVPKSVPAPGRRPTGGAGRP